MADGNFTCLSTIINLMWKCTPMQHTSSQVSSIYLATSDPVRIKYKAMGETFGKSLTKAIVFSG